MKKKGQTKGKLDKNFLSSKVNGTKNKLYGMKEKTIGVNDCEKVKLEHSEELNPDDFE